MLVCLRSPKIRAIPQITRLSHSKDDKPKHHSTPNGYSRHSIEQILDAIHASSVERLASRNARTVRHKAHVFLRFLGNAREYQLFKVDMYNNDSLRT
jgi:hypothetical protein